MNIFGLRFFTEKMKIGQIPVTIFSGLISSSESNEGNILHLCEFSFEWEEVQE